MAQLQLSILPQAINASRVEYKKAIDLLCALHLISVEDKNKVNGSVNELTNPYAGAGFFGGYSNNIVDCKRVLLQAASSICHAGSFNLRLKYILQQYEESTAQLVAKWATLVLGAAGLILGSLNWRNENIKISLLVLGALLFMVGGLWEARSRIGNEQKLFFKDELPGMLSAVESLFTKLASGQSLLNLNQDEKDTFKKAAYEVQIARSENDAGFSRHLLTYGV